MPLFGTQVVLTNSIDGYVKNCVISGIKDYSNWPTIPQVYMNGEFIGGCDIMMDMHKNGDLIEELGKVGIRSTVLDKAKDTET